MVSKNILQIIFSERTQRMLAFSGTRSFCIFEIFFDEVFMYFLDVFFLKNIALDSLAFHETGLPEARRPD